MQHNEFNIVHAFCALIFRLLFLFIFFLNRMQIYTQMLINFNRYDQSWTDSDDNAWKQTQDVKKIENKNRPI